MFSGMLRRGDWSTVMDVWKDYTAFTFRVKLSKYKREEKRREGSFLDCLTLKMKALQFLEMSVTLYQSTRRNIPED